MASTSSSNKISPKKRTYPPPEPLPYAQTSLKKKRTSPPPEPLPSTLKRKPPQIPLYLQLFLFQSIPAPNLPPMKWTLTIKSTYSIITL